jgi:hypothetical protein
VNDFLSLTFEKLYQALMFLRLLAGIKRAEIFSLLVLANSASHLSAQTITARPAAIMRRIKKAKRLSGVESAGKWVWLSGNFHLPLLSELESLCIFLLITT